MCYGQSGAGKTHSMFGSAFDGLNSSHSSSTVTNSNSNKENAPNSNGGSANGNNSGSGSDGTHGLFQLSVFDLFSRVRELQAQSEVRSVTVLTSCYQIYLETITDLLNPPTKYSNTNNNSNNNNNSKSQLQQQQPPAHGLEIHEHFDASLALSAADDNCSNYNAEYYSRIDAGGGAGVSAVGAAADSAVGGAAAVKTKSRRASDADDVAVDFTSGPYIHNLTVVKVDDESSLISLVVNALRKGRIVRDTSNNSTSSRSHAVVQMVLQVVREEDSEDTDTSLNTSRRSSGSNSSHHHHHHHHRHEEQSGDPPSVVTVSSTLYCVDLAGSERLLYGENHGPAMKESASIGIAAGALQRCIHALRQQQQAHNTGKVVHIPYRDSKLTRVVLQNCFGSYAHNPNPNSKQQTHGAKTVLLLAVSPCEWDYSNSLSTCRFGKSCALLKPRLLAYNRGVVTGRVTAADEVATAVAGAAVSTKNKNKFKNKNNGQSGGGSDDVLTDSEVTSEKYKQQQRMPAATSALLSNNDSNNNGGRESPRAVLPQSVKDLLKTPLKSRNLARGRIKSSPAGMPPGAVFSLKAFLHNCHVSAVVAAEAEVEAVAEAAAEAAAAATTQDDDAAADDNDDDDMSSSSSSSSYSCSCSSSSCSSGLTSPVLASSRQTKVLAVNINPFSPAPPGEALTPPVSTPVRPSRNISPVRASDMPTPVRSNITPVKPRVILTPPRSSSTTPKLQHHNVLTPGRLTPTPGVLTLTDFEEDAYASPPVSASSSVFPSPAFKPQRSNKPAMTNGTSRTTTTARSSTDPDVLLQLLSPNRVDGVLSEKCQGQGQSSDGAPRDVLTGVGGVAAVIDADSSSNSSSSGAANDEDENVDLQMQVKVTKVTIHAPTPAPPSSPWHSPDGEFSKNKGKDNSIQPQSAAVLCSDVQDFLRVYHSQ